MILLLFACTQKPLFTAEEKKILLRMQLLDTSSEDSSNQFAKNTATQNFGELLFFETRLSQTDEISCSTCHNPEKGWADGLTLAQGLSQTQRHAPSLWAAPHMRWMNWDGSCDSLWCQATGPLEKPGEMGMTRIQLVHTLQESETLRSTYEELFGVLPDTSSWPISGSPASFVSTEDQEAWLMLSEEEQNQATSVLVNVAKSIAAFEGTIATPLTPLDTFVETLAEDEQEALSLLSAAQERGMRLFVGEGQCHLCHSGPYLTDSQFHNIGLPITDTTPEEDLGRYSGLEVLFSHPFRQSEIWSDDPNGIQAQQVQRLTRSSEDLGRFKTPSLRQLSQTAPYMHTGQFQTLLEVVSHYTQVNENPIQGHTEEFLFPLEWTDQDKEAVVQFLLMASNTQ